MSTPAAEIRSLIKNKNDDAILVENGGHVPVDSKGLKALARNSKNKRSGFGQFIFQVNRNVAQGVGLPGDIINSGIAATGSDARLPIGSQDVIDLMNKSGIGASNEPPNTAVGRAGQFTGMAAQLLLPSGFFGKVSRTTIPTTKATDITRNIAADIGTTTVAAPATTAAIELGLSATSGATGFIAKEQFPDSELAEFYGDMTGALVPIGVVTSFKALVPKLPLIRSVIKIGESSLGQIKGIVTPKGAKKRSSDRIDRATSDRDAALRESQNSDFLPGLTPTQKTGDEGLMQLEKSVIESSDQLSRQADDQIAEINSLIRNSLDKIGGKATEQQTKEAIKEAQGYLTTLLKTRIKIAAQAADEKIAALGTNTSLEEANRITRLELDKALKAARKQETELYKIVNQDTVVPYLETIAKLKQFKDELGKAQHVDITHAAKIVSNIKGNTTNIKEIRAVQSKLREDARIARANKEFNRARISDDVADSITVDIGNATAGEGQKELLDNAIGFSRTLNENFNKGSVGKILGKNKQGGETIPSGRTLDATVGTGSIAREAFDDIIKAADTPEVNIAINDFIKHRFMKVAVAGGKIDPGKAATFFKQNDELLKRLPELRSQLDDAVESGNLVNLRQRQSDSVATRLGKPSISKATMFIERSPAQAFKEVSASANPDTEMQNLINMTKRDSTGEATEGLKSSFIKWIKDRAEIPKTDINEILFLSGAKLRAILDDPAISKMMERLFTKQEIKQIRRVERTAVRMDTVRKTTKSKEGIISDTPNAISSIFARIGGAQLGRIIAKHTGGGTVQTPGILSAKVQEMLKAGVKDPSERLLIDAFQDEKLFAALLVNRSSRLKQKQAASQRINAWAISVLNEVQGSNTRAENE